VFVESKGREEENAGDPDYADALENYIGDVANAATDTALILGTAVKELPKDVPDQDSEDFLVICTGSNRLRLRQRKTLIIC
jgi:hypothetical protein